MARSLGLLVTSMIVALLLTTPVRAAESVDQAVTDIAKRFVAARDKPDAKPMRVAVTAFVQSDRKTTQLTKLIMIALTGKMVQHGSSQFRVIERAQMEAALAEIQLSDVPIFDSKTARELGKFLGVEALIVGEITTLTDTVRIDARLIEVESVEMIEQADVWIPLTPTIQRQLDTLTVLSRPRIGSNDTPDLRNGIWNGTGQCGESQFGVAISLIVNADNRLSAMQTYFPMASQRNSDLRSGVLAMEGTIDPDSGAFTLNPGNWMYQPEGHEALGFSGTLNLEDLKISGKYLGEGCGQISLRRMN